MLLDPLLKRFAFQILERQIEPALVLACSKNRDDVRMREPRGGLCLDEKLLASLFGCQVRRPNELERDLPAKPRVTCQIDLAHAAAADRADDRIVSQSRAGTIEHLLFEERALVGLDVRARVGLLRVFVAVRGGKAEADRGDQAAARFAVDEMRLDGCALFGREQAFDELDNVVVFETSHRKDHP